MKQFLFKRAALALPVAVVGLFAGGNAFGATILYDNLLANASFEASTNLAACPTSWTCLGSAGSGLVGSYAPTNTEYVAGADGLSGSKNAPDGKNVATTPVPVEGSGGMYQTGLGTYVAGNTYTLDLFIGTPLVVPSVTSQAAAQVGQIRIFFLGSAGLATPLANVFATPSATPGQWTFQQFSFTPTGNQVGQSIGLLITVDSGAGFGSGNNRIADFDIAAPTAGVPEPASIGLLGLGLLGIGAVSRKFKKS